MNAHREEYRLTGFVSLPTLHRSSSQHQYFFVNGRPVQDKVLAILVRVAYQDLVPQGRYSLVVHFVEVPLQDLDVNVHPAKTKGSFAVLVCLQAISLI